MVQERRRCARQSPNDPEICEVDTNNGGLLVDVSEEGLGFQLVSPIEKDEPVDFSFSLGLNRLMKAKGSVVWVSHGGTKGGLQFTELPDDTRGQIRKWLETYAPRIHAETSTAALPSKLEIRDRQEEPNPFAARPAFPPKDLGDVFSRSPWIERQSETPSSHKRHAAVILAGLLVVAGFTGAWLSSSQRQQLMAKVMEIRKSLSGPAKTRPAPTPAPPAAAPKAPSPQGPALSSDPFSVARARPTKKSQSLSALSRAYARGMPWFTEKPPAAAPEKLHPANSQNSGRDDYLRGEKYLADRGTPRNPVQAARWFWAALGDGYTPAAIPLADLYLRGDGVARSCIQARVLLTAAVRKNNAAAARKLGQLPENCE